MNRMATGALCAFLCGIACCAEGRAAGCERNLFVAVTGDPFFGDGSARNPYRTITPAVARARSPDRSR